jgi:hypothetical protein
VKEITLFSGIPSIESTEVTACSEITCYRCKQQTFGMCFDSSTQEYTTLDLCCDCVEILLAECRNHHEHERI